MEHKHRLAATTNPRGLSGSLADALVGADVFVGVSGGTVPEADIARMAPDSIIFALANPDPEVDPAVAAKYAAVVATGRSDFPNQINNVLAFPGIFRGALDSGAPQITEAMKLAAARAIADLVADADSRRDRAQRLRCRRGGNRRGVGRKSGLTADAGRQEGPQATVRYIPFATFTLQWGFVRPPLCLRRQHSHDRVHPPGQAADR